MQVSHIVLRVSSLEESISFYRDRVGLTVLGSSATFAFLDAGTVRIALNEREDQASDTSLTEIVLEVEDIAAEHEAMVGRGVPFEIEPRDVMRDGDRALRAAHFPDPDGHLWSISGWVNSPE